MKAFLAFVGRERKNWRLGKTYLATSFVVGMSMVVVLAGFSPPGSDTAFGSDWVGDTSQDWNDATNWNSDPNPPTGNFGIFTDAAGVFPILSANSAFTPVDVFVGSFGTNTGRFDHRAGSLALADVGPPDGNWFMVGTNSSTATGTYNLADTSGTGGTLTGFAQGSGSLTVGKIWVGGGVFNDNGTGTLNINTSGTLTANSIDNFLGITRASVILGVDFDGTASGTVNLDNGTVQANSELWVGFSAAGTFNQSNGTVNSTEYFVIGRENTSVGTYNMSGGLVNAATGFGFAVLGSFGGSSGTLNSSGGTFDASVGGMIVGEGGTGVVNVSGTGLVNLGANHFLTLGANGGGSGTVNLNGGAIQANSVVQGAGTGTFNFNGGTLRATANDSTFVQGLTAANVNAGGAVIDSNGFNITINQTLLDGGGGGGLTKNGAGTLELTAANGYTGTTTINAGTLLANNGAGSATGSGAVNVVGGTLGGNGSVSGAVSAIGGAISPGTSIESLGVGALSFGAASTYIYEINSNQPLVSAADLLDSTGTLSITTGATLSASDLGSTQLANGTKLTMISYVGAWNGGTFAGLPNFGTIVIGPNQYRIRYADVAAGSNFAAETLDNNAFVTLTVVPEASSFLILGLGGLFATALVRLVKRLGFSLFAI
jgi:autotransporter-associated beta strand protein